MFSIAQQSRNSKYRKELLKRQTTAEKYMTTLLRGLDIQFMPQKGFLDGQHHYIVDFYLPKPYRLCIEIDGEYHQTEKQKAYDMRRDEWLIRVRGFRVIRFSNIDVLANPQMVRETLLSITGKSKPPINTAVGLTPLTAEGGAQGVGLRDAAEAGRETA